ncbi:hypothetical protein K3495_g13135 [Podosphaera aphanis]|nr:hypothetical protein K3495_g13135 [Podosphaera aphanis]
MPEQTLSATINNIRGAIGMTSKQKLNPDEIMFINRKVYHNKNGGYSSNQSHSGGSHGDQPQNFTNGVKRCYCCREVGCRSWNHSKEEQNQARKRNSHSEIDEEAIILDSIRSNTDEEPVGGFFITADSNDEETPYNYMTSSYSTDDDHIHKKVLLSKLQDALVFHAITSKIPLIFKNREDARERYDDSIWHGVMIDTGVGKYLTAGHQQFRAYARDIDQIRINSSLKIAVAFGKGSTCRSV